MRTKTHEDTDSKGNKVIVEVNYPDDMAHIETLVGEYFAKMVIDRCGPEGAKRVAKALDEYETTGEIPKLEEKYEQDFMPGVILKNGESK